MVGGQARGGGMSGANVGPLCNVSGSRPAAPGSMPTEASVASNGIPCDHAHELIEAQVPGAHGPWHGWLSPLVGQPGAFSSDARPPRFTSVTAWPTTGAAASPAIPVMPSIDDTAPWCTPVCQSAHNVPLPCIDDCRSRTVETAATSWRARRMSWDDVRFIHVVPDKLPVGRN